MDQQEQNEPFKLELQTLEEKLLFQLKSQEKRIIFLEEENRNLKERMNNSDKLLSELNSLIKQHQISISTLSPQKSNFSSQIANSSDFQLISQWLNIPALQEDDLIKIYSSEKHGMTKQAFMEHCCDISPTLILCKSSYPFITKFGAYTETKWLKTDSHQYTNAPGAFLFSLTRKQKIEQHKNFEKAQWHTGMKSSWMFGFGMADDFAVKEEDLINNKALESNEMSESELGHTFGSGFIHGSENAQTFLAGAHQFKLAVIEVYTLRQLIENEINS